MANAHCAICRRVLAADAPKPFCSDGCRRVDLARWLGGEYAFAAADLGDHAGLRVHSLNEEGRALNGDRLAEDGFGGAATSGAGLREPERSRAEARPAGGATNWRQRGGRS